MLKTNVDSMLELLELNKPVALEEIAKKLNISESIVEKIAKYLEEEEILKLHYKFVKPYAILIKPMKKSEALDFEVNEKISEIEKINQMLDLIDSSLIKKELYSAVKMYKQINQLFDKVPDTKARKDLYKRVVKTYRSLIKMVKISKKAKR